ncbi:hypothetical protein CPB85DRAFT_1314752 [Mucidula mucida]|nr:hypothetical protein CPB85DRAFT_1314752 [Mucidula mucida]
MPASPVDILHVRGLSLACPRFQSFETDVEVSNRIISVLRRFQRHTLEHLSLPVTIPPVELALYDFVTRLKSLRVSSRVLPPCIIWLTRALESGSFLELTAITIDIHIASTWTFDTLILKDKDKDDWRDFGTIVRLVVDNFSDHPSQEEFQALLAGEGFPVLNMLSVSG